MILLSGCAYDLDNLHPVQLQEWVETNTAYHVGLLDCDERSIIAYRYLGNRGYAVRMRMARTRRGILHNFIEWEKDGQSGRLFWILGSKDLKTTIHMYTRRMKDVVEE